MVKMLCKKQKGSFTVELALLMPMLLAILLFVMYASFYLYNREAATAIVAEAVLKGVQMEQSGKNEIRGSISDFLKKETDKRLIFIEELNYEVNVTWTHVKVQLDLIQTFPYRNVSYSTYEKMSRLHPVSVLWEAERLKK